jgi:hypothetical protein
LGALDSSTVGHRVSDARKFPQAGQPSIKVV